MRERGIDGGGRSAWICRQPAGDDRLAGQRATAHADTRAGQAGWRLVRIPAALTAVRRSLKKRGWRGIAMLAVSKLYDRLFDARYGTDTHTWVELPDMGGTGAILEHALPYRPTDVLALRKLFRALDLSPGRVLVDFGCGKARVLMVGAQFGFRGLRGVEFSAGLCEVARRNIARYRESAGVSAEFEIVHGDAAEYVVREDEDVFFLFNPFDDVVVRRVMDNISRSYRAQPRHMLLIYRRPVHEACITDNTPFEKAGTHLFWGSDFAVFEAAAAPVNPESADES